MTCTKWHDLHQMMPGIPPTDPADRNRWRIKNIIANPHLASQYIHCRFTLFLEEVLKKGLHTTDYWCRYATTLFFLFVSLHTNNALNPSSFSLFPPHPHSRYEWQHRGSAHIHGFLWLEDAPNMDTLDWNNVDELIAAKTYFDKYVTAQNPRPLDC